VLADSDETVPKRGENKHFNYKYATADDLRLHVGKRIGKHGLSYEQHEAGYTPFGSLIAVHYFFVLVHASGETAPPERRSVLVNLVSNRGSPDEKAFSKASVLALKDWAKIKLSIATGDQAEDPDAHEAPVTQRPTYRSPPRPSAASAAFRSAGLPPKAEPASVPHDPDNRRDHRR
jgi:hypothetical protein